MKKAKIIFGVFVLAIFSLSFAMNTNNSSNDDPQQEETILKSKIKVPRNG